jgi:hypothetical protein
MAVIIQVRTAHFLKNQFLAASEMQTDELVVDGHLPGDKFHREWWSP